MAKWGLADKARKELQQLLMAQNKDPERIRKFGHNCAISLTIQIDPQATKTQPWTAIMFKLLQFSTVIGDPLIYIIYHERYRHAIQQYLFNCSGGKINFLKTKIDSDARNSARNTVEMPEKE